MLDKRQCFGKPRAGGGSARSRRNSGSVLEGDVQDERQCVGRLRAGGGSAGTRRIRKLLLGSPCARGSVLGGDVPRKRQCVGRRRAGGRCVLQGLDRN